MEFVAAVVVVARGVAREGHRIDVAAAGGEGLARHEPGLGVKVGLGERLDAHRDVEVAGALLVREVELIGRVPDVAAAGR